MKYASIRIKTLALALALALALGLGLFAAGAPGPAHARDAKISTETQKKARQSFLDGKKKFALGHFAVALEQFSKAYELLPLPGFLFNIGQCHRFLGNCKKAIFYYSGFVRENPDTPDAKFVTTLIAKCRAQLRSGEQKRLRAKGLFEEGRKSYVLGQYREALGQLTSAYRVLPVPGYLYHIALTHQGLHQYDKAIHFFGAYLKQNPGSPQAREVRAALATCRQAWDKEQDRRRRADRIKHNLKLGPDTQPIRTRPPVYKRWWFWTSIAAAAAIAVGLGVGLSQRSDGNQLPDVALTINNWSRR